MQAHELVELAALVASHATVLVRGPEALEERSIDPYWVTSKTRLDRWGRALKRLAGGSGWPAGKSGHSKEAWVRGVLEEIVTGEVLTRVWAGVMCAYDRARQTDLMEPVARSVLLGHMEARHRVLTLLVRSASIDTELAVKLNRLRRRTERWTDLLIGSMADLEGTVDLAVDAQRAAEFGEDLRWQQSHKGGRHVWPLLLASLKASFAQGLGPISPNADLNAKIASSILACFQPGLFESTGMLRSAWLLRISSTAQDTQGMIDELLALEGQTPTEPEADRDYSRLLERLRRFGA